MEFGAFVPQGWRLDLVGIPVDEQWNTMLAVAHTIESSGYESLWLFDHFHTVPVPTQEVTYEAWSLMAALAATTDTVRLGQMCTCTPYRNPAYLAKVASSIDAISGGRVEMGIGAGWYEHEFDGYGYEFRKPSERIAMLREGVEIMQAMWRDPEVHYDGKYYRLAGAICQPKPVQQPSIPTWVAGGGEQLTLRVVARCAQYSNWGGSLTEWIHKSEVLQGHCDAVGRDFAEITRSMDLTTFCVPDAAAGEEKMRWFRSKMAPYIDPDDVVNRYGLVARTPEQIIDEIRPYKDAGMAYLIVNLPDAAYDRAGLELFAREVIPALR
jgi:F420-dependent oxidoreductase-like protein